MKKMKRSEPVVMLELGMRDVFYGQIDPRRKQEVADSRMIQEDHNAMANLSPRAINREFDAGRFAEAFKFTKHTTDEIHEF